MKCKNCDAGLTSPIGVTLKVCPFCNTNNSTTCYNCGASLTSPKGITLSSCPFCNGVSLKSESTRQNLEGITEYNQGILCKKRNDYVGAVEWFSKAMEKGYEGAEADINYCLGFMYGAGYGISRDDTLAISKICKAAEQGHDEAQYHLILMYLSNRNYEKAKEWCLIAENQGNEITQPFVNRMKNSKKGEKWDVEAQSLLGIRYMKGGYRNAVAEEWLRKAAEQGDEGAKKILDINFK
jgi:TPR repeat protein